MRSTNRAVVFAVTWTLLIAYETRPERGAWAASRDFLQDCPAQATSASSEQSPLVIGRRKADGSSLVVAMGQRGIYESRDRGETWALLTPPGKCHRQVEAFWDNAPDGDTLCVVTKPEFQGYNTWCSYDRGLNWQVQTWIKDAVQVTFDPADPGRAFGLTPTNLCNKVCSGPTYNIAMSFTKSRERHCACNLQLAHTGTSEGRLYALRDLDAGGQNQMVGFSPDMERATRLIREPDPSVRLLQLFANPYNGQSFVVTFARRTPLGSEDALQGDALYESDNNGRSLRTVELLFAIESVQFVNALGDIAALVHPPHTPDVAYIGRKFFNTGNQQQWQWSRAPEPQGRLLSANGVLYFAGKHLYIVDEAPYTVIDPVY